MRNKTRYTPDEVASVMKTYYWCLQVYADREAFPRPHNIQGDNTQINAAIKRTRILLKEYQEIPQNIRDGLAGDASVQLFWNREEELFKKHRAEGSDCNQLSSNTNLEICLQRLIGAYKEHRDVR